MMGLSSGSESTRWVVHGERVVDDSRTAKPHVASVELPDGARFEQYVLRCPPAAMVAATDAGGRVLMMRRHRFVIDRWVWELPGGYVDDGEDLASAAARELLEETGWRAGRLEHLVTYQPMVGVADHECAVYLGADVERVTADRDVNEAQDLAWITPEEAAALTGAGEIVGAASVLAVLALQTRTATSSP
jgi:ADP-ribose pyrophosphatase